MKKKLTNYLFFIFSFYTILVGAQKDYKGRVVDATTKEPLAYVNIGIQEAGIGTVSDEEGLFHMYLEQDKFRTDEQIIFSSLGYETLYIPISEIQLVYNDYPEIALKPKLFELNEIVVSNKGERFIPDNVGYRNYGVKNYGYWKDNIALGGELATRIVVKSGLRKLNNFEFEVWHNPSDSLLLRVNIYDDNGGSNKPGINLNTSSKNILTTVKTDDKMVKVDLRPFDIYVMNDFIISLELLKIYGDEELGLVLLASLNQFGSYRKYASQDNWESLSDTNMAYYVQSELMVSEKLAQRFERKKEKKKKKQRTVSGFVIMKGKMISGVSVLNNRTKADTISDDGGRYIIPADKGDILTFSKEGYKDFSFEITDKITQNVVLRLK
ncbi:MULTISPECIES: carboxypeptidase-like regulatory domain-containing protein [Croceitalea]|uniref:Carboxypeptidase-like regulatory domain-containing protein n=1 Tax=Croceitalea vernalis TaxID=3075599 RepID=A0ABU3BGR0_9FLAO|nr:MULTISPECIES: carboxypeptidase-like regulatory domain-containing protein [unclassified Croceitalea]MDT0539545.1 carboxypeptidase-like regulatory domain-containing protein [Croceitalea sp. P059]MDT0621337.1 carboxypeptidase-like regulatory domain-containing protein [Croceitalea sp. P007]